MIHSQDPNPLGFLITFMQVGKYSRWPIDYAEHFVSLHVCHSHEVVHVVLRTEYGNVCMQSTLASPFDLASKIEVDVFFFIMVVDDAV